MRNTSLFQSVLPKLNESSFPRLAKKSEFKILASKDPHLVVPIFSDKDHIEYEDLERWFIRHENLAAELLNYDQDQTLNNDYPEFWEEFFSRDLSLLPADLSEDQFLSQTLDKYVTGSQNTMQSDVWNFAILSEAYDDKYKNTLDTKVIEGFLSQKYPIVSVFPFY